MARNEGNGAAKTAIVRNFGPEDPQELQHRRNNKEFEQDDEIIAFRIVEVSLLGYPSLVSKFVEDNQERKVRRDIEMGMEK